MQHDFGYTLYLDDLPSATILRDKEDREMAPDYGKGIPVGKFEGLGKIMLYNHLDITVVVHDTLEGHHRIVGFEVEPFSLAEDQHRLANDPKSSTGPLYLKPNQEFTFSYRIITRPDPKTSWGMRMDHYVKFGDNNIHLANILYSLAAIGAGVLILSALLARSLTNDFKAIELLSNKRKEKRDQRRFKEGSEDEVGLASGKPKNIKSEDVAWKKL